MELSNAFSGVVRPIPPPNRELEHRGKQGQCPIGEIRGLFQAGMKLLDIATGDLSNLQTSQFRQNEASERGFVSSWRYLGAS